EFYFFLKSFFQKINFFKYINYTLLFRSIQNISITPFFSDRFRNSICTLLYRLIQNILTVPFFSDRFRNSICACLFKCN
ncbi:hypothetical protein OAG24_00560, partial [bacterium]|nr:hypothetical protein [bacterium]